MYDRKINDRNRRIVGITAMLVVCAIIFILIAYAYGKTAKMMKTHQASRPLLVIQQADGKLIDITDINQPIPDIAGPARAWSPQYGLGVVVPSGKTAYQLQDTAVELSTAGGTYEIYLQPAGWGEVEHDLKKNKGHFMFNLK